MVNERGPDCNVANSAGPPDPYCLGNCMENEAARILVIGAGVNGSAFLAPRFDSPHH
jgi:hypothetical protein